MPNKITDKSDFTAILGISLVLTVLIILAIVAAINIRNGDGNEDSDNDQDDTTNDGKESSDNCPIGGLQIAFGPINNSHGG